MKYSVGLDIGTGSVGWAVIDPDTYQLLRVKGKNTIGVRLFDGASTAEERRGFRTTRRRLSRRRWRMRLLNELFAPELAKVDENFLPRLKYSWVNPKDASNPQINDKDANGAIFGTSELDKAFYEKYPTIYHLRADLLKRTTKADLREIYLAIHHIVKYRGHFLNKAEAIDTNKTFNVHLLQTALANYTENLDETQEFLAITQPNEFADDLQNLSLRKKERQEQAVGHMSGNAKRTTQLVGALLGYKINLETLLNIDGLTNEEKKKYSVQFDDEELDDKLSELTALNEAQLELIEALRTAYTGLQLKQILGDKTSISEAMIVRYNSHAEQLKWLKAQRLTKDKDFDQQYANWIAEKDVDGTTKYFKKLIETATDDTKNEILQLIEDGQFLPTQRNKSNGNIPHQIHGNELRKIIENQVPYYPFLAETFQKDNQAVNKIEQLLKFRVPYYVGPLATDESEGNTQNHWLIKKDGQEKTVITPWNIDEVVDKDQSGEQFIKRMTGTDTYLLGEPALAANTPTYQIYNVLQELNNVRIGNHRLDVHVKQKLFNQLFKTTKTVSAKAANDWLAGEYGKEITLTGLSDPKKFNSSLTSYHDLKKVFGEVLIEKLWRENLPLLDEIVEIQTVFEDGDIALRRLQKVLPAELQDYALPLSEKHYTGWGRLSDKLLNTKIVRNLNQIPGKHDFTDGQKVASIVEVLWHSSLNLMEIIGNANDTYEVTKWINEQNLTDEEQTDVYHLIDELAGSKEIKRGITQAFKILDDIKRAFGVEPERVYLEFAREAQQSSLSVSRWDRVQALYKTLTKQDKLADLEDELAQETKERLQDDRLYLYYLQQGKDMYTGKPLEISKLSDYDIDHIIPQAMVKDNSIDNRVLVSSRANRLKNNSEVIPTSIRTERAPFWRRLQAQGFISKQKLDNLMRSSISDVQKERFIARSLVETRQIIKNVATLIDSHFDKTKAVPVRSQLTSDMRQYLKVFKNRDINDYHHAHDALLVATVGQYVVNKGFFEHGKLSDNLGHEYNRYTKHQLEEARKTAGNSERVNPFSMVVGTMAAATERKAGLVPSVYVGKDSDIKGTVVWTAENKAYLLKVLDYSKMLVTKKTGISSGNLSDQTLYGVPSKSGKRAEKLIPYNSSRMDVSLYGGQSSPLTAHTALIKNKKGYELINITLAEYNKLNTNGRISRVKLQNYLRNKIIGYTKNGDPKYVAPFAEVILPMVPTQQLIVKSGQYIYVASQSEANNAEQLYLPRRLYDAVNYILAHKEHQSEYYADQKNFGSLTDLKITIFEALRKGAERYSNYPKLAMELNNYPNQAIEALDFESYQKVVTSLLQKAMHANAKRSKDIKKESKVLVDGTVYAISDDLGRMTNKLVMDENDLFIFQSPTGLFERRITIKELAQKAGIQ